MNEVVVGKELIDISGRVRAGKERKIQAWPVRSNRASELGHPCVLYLYFLRTAWSQRALPTVTLAFIFENGRRIEDEAINELKNDGGFQILEQSRPFEWPIYQITGKIDCKLREPEAPHNEKPYPGEIKGLQHHDWERMNFIQDFLDSEKIWLIKYPAQVMLYLLMDASPVGFLYLKSKSTNEPKHIWTKLDDHLDIAEAALVRAQKVNAYMGRKEPQEKVVDQIMREEGIKYCPVTCERCDFRHICLVGTEYIGVEIIASEELEKMLNQRQGLIPAYQEYNKIDKQVKELFRGKPETIVGNFLITGKAISRTAYDIPDDVKKQYAVEESSWRINIKQLGEPEKENGNE
jgi:hypothetical protein